MVDIISDQRVITTSVGMSWGSKSKELRASIVEDKSEDNLERPVGVPIVNFIRSLFHDFLKALNDASR